MQSFAPPFRIQLAIQGGGAKICVLLAAMEALQKMHNDKFLQVTRIAGTSAGSIVGSLFAAGIDMKLVKEKLRRLTPHQLAQLFPAPTKLRVLTRLGSGRPLWDKDFLEKQLNDIFGEARMYTFANMYENTKIKMHVVAANLGETGKEVYHYDHDPNKQIVPAILDSCGLPYCFRVWTKGDNPVIVDGGICENLPSEELEEYQPQDGPVLGISFDPVMNKSPSNLKDFTIALLDTAINNSMSRAKQRLGLDRVFSIKTNIGTFDFRKALTEGLGDHYEIIKRDAQEFFTSFVSSRVIALQGEKHPKQVVSSEAWKEQSLSMMEKLYNIYKMQHLGSKLRYVKCSLRVQANCLVDDPDNTFYRAPDYVYYSLKFEANDGPIYCHGVSLSETENNYFLNKTEFTIINDSDETSVKTVNMPMQDPSFPKKKQLLLHFTPPLSPSGGPYTLECRDIVCDFMKALKEKKKDELYMSLLRAIGQVGIVDIVLFLPHSSAGARMLHKTGSPEGRPMSPNELMMYTAPFGFYAVGWTGKNLDPNVPFGADILL